VTVRVLLVDDHPIVVDGLVAALARDDRIAVVGSAGSVAEARHLIELEDPDVVLLDLRLPDGSGVEILHEARERGRPSMLVLSSFSGRQYVSAAIAMGASGYMLKTAPSSEIIGAIVAVADGGVAFTAAQLRASRTLVWEPLTPAEHAIIEGVMRGRSNDELRTDLALSRKAIEGHLARLFARYGAATRTELAVHAEREGVLELPVGARKRRSVRAI